MIQLNYQTNNPRWGWTGVKFSDWNSFSLTLGFLSNIRHFKGHGTTSSIWSNSISMHIEGNNQQGAWDKEGRIHYYKRSTDLQSYLADLETHSSAGNKSTTCRINSNGYILSLVHDFDFKVKTYTGYSTADIFPPDNSFSYVKSILNNFLNSINLSIQEINSCLNSFDKGFNL